MALVRFQYEPVSSLDVNEICFDQEQNIPNTRKKSIKSQNATECCRCGKCRVMDIAVECLSCGEVEALGYFQLLDMRYVDKNVVTERVSAIVLQFFLI